MDLLKEVERNLQDAMNVVRNVMVNPKLVPGGGATEIALAVALNEKVRGETSSSNAPLSQPPPLSITQW
jgi:T-complex protein 1 subunit gamma